MANKYLRHGETFNGNGTSSAAATVDGGVGAWNSLNVYDNFAAPNYGGGSLVAGDTVIVRTKDASGSDITRTAASATSLGNSSASELLPITWVFDDGTVWSGVSGTVRYNGTARIAITIRDWNNIKAKNYNFVVGNTLTTVTDVGALTLGTGYTEDMLCDLSVCTDGNGPYVMFRSGYHVNLWVKSHGRYQAVFRARESKCTLTLYNPQIELLGVSETDPVFSLENCFGVDPITVYGGRVFGVGSTNGAVMFRGSNNDGTFRAFGLQYPREMQLSSSAWFADKTSGYADGADGKFGSEYYGYFYAYTSRSDNFPPVLNAFLENSTSDKWSYRLYPYRTSQANPARISMSKTWTQAAATKTITQELLWPTSMAAPTNSGVYLVIQYIDDSTGLPKTISTRDFTGATLSTSTASWSAATWGMVSFTKYKLSATTPTTIKQDTAIVVTLFVAPKSATVNDVMFIDPDPSLT